MDIVFAQLPETFTPSSKDISSAHPSAQQESTIFLCADKKTGIKACLETGLLKEVNTATHGLIASSVAASEFTFAKRKILNLWCPESTAPSQRLRLMGLGTLDAFKTQSTRVAFGGWLMQRLQAGGEPRVAQIFIEGIESSEEIAVDLAYGACLRNYTFDTHHGKIKDQDTNENTKEEGTSNTLEKLTFYCNNPDAARAAFVRYQAVSSGVKFARDLVSEPPNHLTPSLYATRIAETLAPLGVKVRVIDEPELKTLGMGSLLSVAQGSQSPAHVVIMEWTGGDADEPPYALIGKGVTFDSGGLSLKPPTAMEDMKFDMGGSASVVGTMMALSTRKAKANVVGVVGLVENMPSGEALRPGDVVTSMSGQTIEVLNTDAEGRLVLADLLWYTQQTFKPSAMINLATLTGAIIVSLGHEIAGLFSNSDVLSSALMHAGEKTDERVWRMPLAPVYDKQLDCKVANMKNIGDRGSAGSIVAAQFLQRFVKGCDWAHLDIAGVVWRKKDTDLAPRGATGFGVQLLDEWVESCQTRQSQKESTPKGKKT